MVAADKSKEKVYCFDEMLKLTQTIPFEQKFNKIS